MSEEEVELVLLSKSKFAGWFDLWNKAFYEELCPVWDEWSGYGPWDYYSILISDFVKDNKVDYQQYLLRGETIWMYPSGTLKSDNINGFTQYYRNLLVINELPNQRKEFEAKLPEYINKGIESLKLKNIIPQNVFGKFKS